jgi:hypothetical protein
MWLREHFESLNVAPQPTWRIGNVASRTSATVENWQLRITNCSFDSLNLVFVDLDIFYILNELFLAFIL